jgi:hypothetical protein
MTTSPDRSIDDHESTAEFEDRQHRLQQHRQVQRGPIPVRFTVIATSVRAHIHCATSLDHPTAVAERTPRPWVQKHITPLTPQRLSRCNSLDRATTFVTTVPREPMVWQD